jgi:hypothetical protein
MANMSKQRILSDAEKDALIDEMLSRYDEWLVDDIYASGKPLTIERMRELGWPVTAEEALARMQENKRKQEEAERKSTPKRKTA